MAFFQPSVPTLAGPRLAAGLPNICRRLCRYITGLFGSSRLGIAFIVPGSKFRVKLRPYLIISGVESVFVLNLPRLFLPGVL